MSVLRSLQKSGDKKCAYKFVRFAFKLKELTLQGAQHEISQENFDLY